MNDKRSEWSNKGNNYRVYLHVFPNGKKYVGSTKSGLKQRWNGGFGYESQNLMFDAICKFGWNNIRHYLLFDGLERETALLIEAALIKKWNTYRRSGGYNARLPHPKGIDGFVVPNYKRVQIYDARDCEELTRAKDRIEKRNNRRCAGAGHYAAVAVYCKEFDETYSSITEASASTGAPIASIQSCLHNRQKTAGTHYVTGERLHWEYADAPNNKERKEETL